MRLPGSSGQAQRIKPALSRSEGRSHSDLGDASLHLVINLVTSTVLQLVLDPPRDVTRRELQDELVRRVEASIRGPA
jgi:hypothetical protein